MSLYCSTRGRECASTVLNDRFDNSQKGKSPITRSIVCYLQDRNAVVDVDSVMNIVRYTYKILYKNFHIFRGPQPNDICKILLKIGQKVDFDSHIENISVQDS